MYTLQPEQKSRGCVNILAVIGGISLALFACVFFGGFTSLSSLSGSSEPHHVDYRITTSECTDFSVTYSLPDGTSQRDVNVCPGGPKIDSFIGARGDFVYLSIQNVGSRYSNARFSCNIEIDGTSEISVQSSGFANIASCSGSIP